MNKKVLIIIVFLGIIVLGFTLGFFPIYGGNLGCTEMYCGCESNSSQSEISCNHCGVWDPIFVSFIIDYGKSCSAREIILCSDGKKTGRRLDVDQTTCKYTFEIFSARNVFW